MVSTKAAPLLPYSINSIAFAPFQPNFGSLISILSLLPKQNFVVDHTVIYLPSFQVVTLHLTFSSTGWDPTETQTLLD